MTARSTLSTQVSIADVALDDVCHELEGLPAAVSRQGELTAFSSLAARCSHLDDVRKGLEPREEMRLRDQFRLRALPGLLQSEFCRYSYDKPRGYAGDFDAMERIWQGRTDPERARYLGGSPLGKLVNAFTLDAENCRANEARVHHFARRLRSLGPARVAAIGSGSAIEVQEAYRAGWGQGSETHLFDQDEGALDRARTRLESSGHDVRYHHGNVLRAVLRDDGTRYDLVYSSGMFDYFDVHTSRRLVARLFARLRSGGALVITNAHPDNPTRMWMEYVADWFLRYKDEAEMRSLADGLDGVTEVDLAADRLGVYQYLTLKR